MGLRLDRGDHMQRGARRLFQMLAALLPAAAASAQESSAPFHLISVPGPGRTAFAEIADLDGDGRGDLVTASFTKLPPSQLRKLRVHFQREDGGFREAPDWVAPLPEGAAAYDFHRTAKGADELLFMRRDRVTRLSLAGRVAAWRDVPLPGTSLAVAPDERGIDRLRLVRGELSGGPLLVVPGFGEVFVSTLDGEPRGLESSMASSTLIALSLMSFSSFLWPCLPSLGRRLVDDATRQVHRARSAVFG
jgi:hypothetical protein